MGSFTKQPFCSHGMTYDDGVHVRSCTRPSPFSACNIENVGVAWERGYMCVRMCRISYRIFCWGGEQCVEAREVWGHALPPPPPPPPGKKISFKTSEIAFQAYFDQKLMLISK